MKGKAGLVTAAGSGMGRAGALRLAREGARVAIADRDGAAAQAVVDEIRAGGGEAIMFAGDLRADEFAGAIATRAADAFGQLDFLWNHVGIPGPESIEDLDMQAYELAFDLNIRSGLMTTRAALPHLIAAKGAAVLFTASTSAMMGSPFSPIYSATKAGQVGLMKSLAKRYGERQVRFNCIAPAATDTPMLREFYNRSADPSQAEKVEGRIATRGADFPLGRIAQPEDIANAALFLLSDEASFITGSVLLVDGGQMA